MNELLEKLYQDNELNKWLGSYPGPYVVEDKIDGMSLLLHSVTGPSGKRQISLYTRGGGYNGKDVSHMIQYMKIPPLNIDISIRANINKRRR